LSTKDTKVGFADDASYYQRVIGEADFRVLRIIFLFVIFVFFVLFSFS